MENSRGRANGLAGKMLKAAVALPLFLGGCSNVDPSQKYGFDQKERLYYDMFSQRPLNGEVKQLVNNCFPEIKGKNRLSDDEAAYAAKKLRELELKDSR
jgi:hypothetical protein